MNFKTDKRLALYLGDSTEDTLFRNRVQVASENLGVSIRSCCESPPTTPWKACMTCGRGCGEDSRSQGLAPLEATVRAMQHLHDKALEDAAICADRWTNALRSAEHCLAKFSGEA